MKRRRWVPLLVFVDIFSVVSRLHFDFTYLFTIYLMFRTAKNGGEVGPDQSRSSNHQGQHPFARLFMKKSDLSCPIFLLTCKFLYRLKIVISNWILLYHIAGGHLDAFWLRYLAVQKCSVPLTKWLLFWNLISYLKCDWVPLKCNTMKMDIRFFSMMPKIS